MRNLRLNQTVLWYVKAIGEGDVKDDDGYYTGEKNILYSEPKKIRLHLYPANGEIIYETFGENVDIDMVTTSTISLDKSTLIFKDKPVDNYETSYSYKINGISKSLNHYLYGLKGRV